MGLYDHMWGGRHGVPREHVQGPAGERRDLGPCSGPARDRECDTQRGVGCDCLGSCVAVLDAVAHRTQFGERLDHVGAPGSGGRVQRGVKVQEPARGPVAGGAGQRCRAEDGKGDVVGGYWQISRHADGQLDWTGTAETPEGIAGAIAQARADNCRYGPLPRLVLLTARWHPGSCRPGVPCACHGPDALLLALTPADRKSLAECMTCGHVWDMRESGDDPLDPGCPLSDQHPPEAILDEVEMAPVTAALKTALAIGFPDDALAILEEGADLRRSQRGRRGPETSRGNSPGR